MSEAGQYPETVRALEEYFDDLSAEEGRSKDVIRKSGFRPALGGVTDTLILEIGPYEYVSPVAAGLRFHPQDFPSWVTLWDLSALSEAIVEVSVTGADTLEGESVYVLNAVYAPTYADLVAGDWEVLSNVAFGGGGFHQGGWQAIDEAAKAEVYVGMVLDVPTEVDELVFGSAEVRLR